MPPGLAIHYALKANPFPPLARRMAELADGFDVASQGEMERALAAGMPRDRISFAGPGKRDRDLVAALAAGVTIHVESEGELDRIAVLAGAAGPARVALRINPPFQLRGSGLRMGGIASPFGVSISDAPRLLARMQDPPFRLQGLHIFAGSQNLDVQSILGTLAEIAALAAELARVAPLGLVNMGGGLGVPYFPQDRALDLEALGNGLAAILGNRPAALADTRFALELGRFLVAEAGVYLCRIVDIKQSGGVTFAVTDGGLHHQLAATGNFGTVIRRNYPVVNASHDRRARTVTVVGCLCTPLDRLADQVALADPAVGDLVAIFMAGAYGPTASPSAFLGHPPAVERLV
jgi:diaminopimelate decarboxylase